MPNVPTVNCFGNNSRIWFDSIITADFPDSLLPSQGFLMLPIGCNGKKEESTITATQQNEILHKEDISKMRATLRAIVTIHVESRDVCHPHGIIGPVCGVKDATCDVLVVCLSWLIYSTNQKINNWIPVDRSLVAKAEDDCSYPGFKEDTK